MLGHLAALVPRPFSNSEEWELQRHPRRKWYERMGPTEKQQDGKDWGVPALLTAEHSTREGRGRERERGRESERELKMHYSGGVTIDKKTHMRK